METADFSGAIRQAGVVNSGLPLGGMGTGGVELWADGRFHFWNMVNSRPWAKWSAENMGKMRGEAPDPIVPPPTNTDFFIRIEEEGKRPVYRWLFTGNGYSIVTASHFWRHHKHFFLRTMREIEYEADFPFINLRYIDDELPVEVSLQAWTSFIPGDAKNSSLPGFYLDFSVKNRTDRDLKISLVWQMQNIAGYNAEEVVQRHSHRSMAGAEMVFMEGSTAEMDDRTSGSLAMWAQPETGQDVTVVSANPYMQNLIWGIHQSGDLMGPLKPERLEREEINERPSPTVPNKGWLCMVQQLAGGGSTQMKFGLGWFFPNHVSNRGTRVGHVYENWFADAAEVAAYLVDHREEFYERSRVMPDLLRDSTLPGKFRVSLQDQCATLIKNSQFIKDGRFGLQEGHGCCAFNTVDVDHYSSYGLSVLFPEIRKKILEMQTALAHPDNGKIHHGLPGTVEEIPAGGGANDGYSRWDCSCQYTLQVYRDTRWSGDKESLRHCFATARRAMELVSTMDFYGIGLPYIQGGITYDHWNMTGVVTYMAGVYLAALRALEEMAKTLEEPEAAEWARKQFERGLKGFEEKLWNGEQYLLYYARKPEGWKPGDDEIGEHKIFEPVRPPESCCTPPEDNKEGEGDCGCDHEKAFVEIADTGVMTDVINGDATAGVMGLGEFLDQDRVRKQLKLIFERNVQPENEVLVNGSYPDGHFLDEFPFAQWQTPWTGTEYFYVLQCYRAGLFELGDRVVEMVYDRHVREGMRWDQAECSNHYSRPLSIWGAYMARVGLEPDALGAALKIAPAGDQNEYRGAFITATGLGRIEYAFTREKSQVSLELQTGEVRLKELTLKALGKFEKAEVSLDGDAVAVASINGGKSGEVRLRFETEIAVAPGQALKIAVTG